MVDYAECGNEKDYIKNYVGEIGHDSKIRGG